MAITAKQATFVAEYLIDLNATQAARRAGYSAANADKIGPKLVGKSRVAAAIAAAQVKRAERVEVTQDWIVKRLMEEAVNTNERGSSRVRALELLGKHLGMFKDKIEVTGKNGGPMETRGGVCERINQLTDSLLAVAIREVKGDPV